MQRFSLVFPKAPNSTFGREFQIDSHLIKNFLACGYGSVCSGCDWLLVPYPVQREMKQDHLLRTLRAATLAHPPPIQFIAIAAGELRDRVDLMIDRRRGAERIGLFDRFQTGIVDLKGCPQMSPALEAWFQEFRRTIHLPIERGSIRLRVAPSGLRGIWLDLANIDVKNLLDRRVELDQLLALGAIVEIGQKRKQLVEREGFLKLADPVLKPWFETYLGDRSQALYCAIGSFTQPGFAANRALIESVTSITQAVGAQTVIEFGSGIGNFTLPLASVARNVRAYEVDVLALEGLRRSLDESGLSAKVVIHSGNYQVERKEPVEYRGTDLVFVDPPRSGLMKFLAPLAALTASERPPHFIYVSCFAESFAIDALRLRDLGYEMRTLKLVDQFPQSRHYEIVAHFAKSLASPTGL